MRSVFVVLLAFLAISATAQNGIKWKYSAKKLSENTYEIHMSAYIAVPWHIYSQHMEEGGPLPTAIAFEPDPAMELIGPIREVGHPVTRHEKVFDMDVTYYTDSVDFVQRVKAGNSVVSGSINFMICKEDQCLAPTVVHFMVKLEYK